MHNHLTSHLQERCLMEGGENESRQMRLFIMILLDCGKCEPSYDHDGSIVLTILWRRIS